MRRESALLSVKVSRKGLFALVASVCELLLLGSRGTTKGTTHPKLSQFATARVPSYSSSFLGVLLPAPTTLLAQVILVP